MAPFGTLLLTVPAVLVLCGASDERGGLDCTIDDQNLAFSSRASFGYRGDKALFGIKGELELKSTVSRLAEQKFVIKGEHLIQQWFYDTDLRLQFYIPAAEGSVSLALLATQSGDGLTYQGTYDLEITGSDGWVKRSDGDGKVTCKMD